MAEHRDNEQADHQDEVDGFVAAAAAGEHERRFVVEDAGGGEGDDGAPGRDGGWVGQVVNGVREKRGEDLSGEAVEAEVEE